jgi:peptide deformylase
MALREIHLLGSPVLREASAEVPAVDDAVRAFVDDLFETMDAADGVGLAANQVGETARVAVVDADGTRIAMVNPRIVEASGRATQEEGCLSVPEIYAEVTRAATVTLAALDREGQPYTLEAAGLLARAIQHEIDHLDGILFLDHLSPLKRTMLVTRFKRENRGKGITRKVLPDTTPV